MKKESKKSDVISPLKPGPHGCNSFFASYPIFCTATDGQGLLITGGGGGGKAYGVLNILQAHVAILDSASRALAVETIASLDTGADAPTALDFCQTQGGVWACALGTGCMLFKFNDETLSMEPLVRWKSELRSDAHLTNFVKLHGGAVMHALTGGEDKIARLWRVNQESGVGSRITDVSLIAEFPDHAAEVVNGDWQPSGQHFLTCGKDGTVKVWSLVNQECVATIQPRSIDKRLANEPLSIRAAVFVNNDVVVLSHHPRGPAFLMLFSLANPGSPVAAIQVSRSITPSLGVNAGRDRIVVSHAGGEKDIFAIPSLRLVHKRHTNSHEMPPCATIFVANDLVVSASPDFSLNFFDPKAKSGATSFCGWIFRLILLVLFAVMALVGLVNYVPGTRVLVAEHAPAVAGAINDIQRIYSRSSEL